MSYGEKRKQAKIINEVQESARLIYMGVQRLQQKEDEEQNQRFFESCRNAAIFASDIMGEPHYSFHSDEIEEIKYFQFSSLDSCVTFADKLTELTKDLQKQANIPRLYYPFLPTSVSNWSFTTLEVLLFFIIGIGLYILL